MAGFLSGPINTTKWLDDADEVFSERTSEGLGNTKNNLKNIFSDLLLAYKLNIKSWWEVQSLEQYIKQKIVPRGLRVNLVPAERSRTENLLKRWEEELTNSSIRLMTILVDEEKVTLEKTSRDLQTLREEALKHQGDSDFGTKEIALQIAVDKYQQNLKTRKHKHFLRDLGDFSGSNNVSAPTGGASFDPSSSDLSDSEPQGRPNRSRSRGRRNFRNRNNWGRSNYRQPRQWDQEQQQPNLSLPYGSLAHGSGQRATSNPPTAVISSLPLPLTQSLPPPATSSSFLGARDPYNLRNHISRNPRRR
ncbi:uncharacterized protein ACNLHF_007006 isoform 1-T3 [Anomaloglossus baeobatrachus]|uniref:uncharacterized protein LOC142255046 n=1 Tax=Anomaloglossus baeobatrachus TaxID=238106 RepID=UPI003F4FECA3